MNYPIFDPIIFDFGVWFGFPIAPRWYGFMYLLSAVLGTIWLRVYAAPRFDLDPKVAEDSGFILLLGGIIGGRVGDVFFYQFDAFMNDFFMLFRMWEGGMSIHGGLMGAVIALVVFARIHNVTFISLAAPASVIVPLALGLGRIGNFINTELPGRITEVAWGVHYPCVAIDPRILQGCQDGWEVVARHPSSLYQAFAEGVVLLTVMFVLMFRLDDKRLLVPSFFIGHGVLRFITEFFRQPDFHLGFLLFGFVTMGQLLSFFMIVVGVIMMLYFKGYFNALLGRYKN